MRVSNSIKADRHIRLLLLLWIVWLPFLVPPVEEVAHGSSLIRTILSFAGTSVFVVIYLWTAWSGLLAASQSNSKWTYHSWIYLAALAAISTGLTLTNGSSWLVMFILTSACIGLHFPNMRGVWCVVALLLITGLCGWLSKVDLINAGRIMLMAGFVGINVLNVVRTLRTNRELREAREEIARLAVNEERLRFARDLHDLLGHNLSLIALQSEMAEYLAPTSLEKSIEAMRKVGTVARSALQEVRAAVSGYRQPSLSAELKGTSEILSAAGIGFEFTGSLKPLPRDVESVLGWAIREGVTNIVRHSRAKHCTINFAVQDEVAVLVIADDGQGIQQGDASARRGNGLTGLAERVRSVNGTIVSDARQKGGYMLTITVPVINDLQSGIIERSATP